MDFFFDAVGELDYEDDLDFPEVVKSNSIPVPTIQESKENVPPASEAPVGKIAETPQQFYEIPYPLGVVEQRTKRVENVVKLNGKQLEEVQKIRDMQSQCIRRYCTRLVASRTNTARSDACTVYVGNVDFSVSTEQLKRHFAVCGKIKRITILTNHRTGRPKGAAYIQFIDAETAETSLLMEDSVLVHRQITVCMKYKQGDSNNNRK